MANGDSSRKRFLVSAVTDDAIVETVCRTDTGETAFAVARNDGVEILAEWRMGGQTFTPVNPNNNLLRHRALLFPSQAAEYGDAENLVADITAYIERYVNLPRDAGGLAAAYVLLSWVYDAFSELPYLRFRGDYGTGKTRALIVVGSLCYKAFFASGASTVSPIFHTLDSFNSTLIFDEADFRFTDEKAELVKILNNGNAKGFPVLRSQATATREFDPRAFSIFGPKIVGMRRSYDDRALESRFLTIEMEPGRGEGVPINLLDSQASEGSALRDKLLMYRIRNRRTTKTDSSLADSHLEPRMNQILLPLLSVAPTQDLRVSIRAAAGKLQSDIVAERSTSAEGQIVAIVAKLVTCSGRPISVADITASFAEEFGGDYDRAIGNRWIASLLRKLGIVLYKSNGVSVFLPRQDDRIAALCARYGVDVGERGRPEEGVQGDREIGSNQEAQG